MGGTVEIHARTDTRLAGRLSIWGVGLTHDGAQLIDEDEPLAAGAYPLFGRGVAVEVPFDIAIE